MAAGSALRFSPAGSGLMRERITSLQNDRVKAIRALEMRKARRETGLFVAEGAALIMTARDRGFCPETLVALANEERPSRAVADLIDWAERSGTTVLDVSNAVMSKLAAKDNPQTLMATFRQRWIDLPNAAVMKPDDVWVVLEEVRDPGNLGTIIRTVDAVGAKGVVLAGNCCDPYSRDGVRATMGSIFTVPLARASRDDVLAWRRTINGDVVGTHLDATKDFRAVDYRGPVLLVMGSEGPGLSEEMAAACSRLVKIPMAGSLDSLNLAVATALTLYQIRGPRLRM